MSAYNLPALPQRKIVAYFKELDIELTEAALMKPTNSLVTKFYMECLLVYKNRNYFVCMENSGMMLGFIKEITDFLSMLGLRNMSFKEIFSPSEKNFTVICSHIANFSMYRDSKKDLYERALEISEGNKNIKNRLLSRKREIRNTIEELRGREGVLYENIREIKSGNEIMNSELKEAKASQKDKLSELNLLKREKMDLSDKLCSLEMIEHNLIQDVKKLQLQIVSNPEELLSLVQEMRVLLSTEKESLGGISRSIGEKMAGISASGKRLEKLKKIHTRVEELAKIEEDKDKIEQREFALTSQIKNYESGIKNKQIRLNHVERQNTHLQSKIEGLGGKSKRFNEEISGKLKEIQAEHSKLLEDKENKETTKRKNNEEIQKYMLMKAQLEGEYQKECTEIIEILNELKTKAEINKLK